MPNQPFAKIELTGVATAEDVAALRREIGELRKVVEALAGRSNGGRVLLSRVEAAQVMGISQSNLDDLTDLPAVRAGTRKLYSVETINRWIREHEKAEASNPGPKAAEAA